MPKGRSNTWTSPDDTGKVVTYRPLALGDTARLTMFHRVLSPQTVRQRFASVLPLATRTEQRRLERQCANDGRRDFALVALWKEEILGVARFTRVTRNTGEFAFLVRDADQSKHIGTTLFRALFDWTRSHCIPKGEEFLIRADIAATNEKMKHIFRRFGFSVESHPRDATMSVAQLVLRN